MQQKPGALSVLLAAAMAISAVPFAGAAAAPVAQDVEAPVVTGLTGAPNPVEVGAEITITATVDDLVAGGSNIQSAEFNVNGGAFAALAASDGVFDSPTEGVTGSFSAGEPGAHEICVVGTDAAGNLSQEACATITAESQIKFEGFYPPVKMQENFVKAGRTIPVKFSLEDPDGAPISLLTTFAGLYSYEVDCESLAGEPVTAVQETGPGHAAIRAVAGDWIALWKTPKSYADSCRVMYVLFDDGSTSPEALFRFR